MCKLCAKVISATAKKYNLPKKVIVDILYNATNFPFGEPTSYTQQLEKVLNKPQKKVKKAP